MLALASIYVQEQRSVTVLVDGDDEGRRRKAKIEAWAERSKQECTVITLSDYKTAPCSIEDFLDPTVYTEAVVAACKQAVDAGHIKPQREAWPTELKRLLSTPDGNGGEERRSLGKRVEASTIQIFGEPISDNAIAIRYSELLQSPSETEDAARRIDQYWDDDSLGKLATAILKALKPQPLETRECEHPNYDRHCVVCRGKFARVFCLRRAKWLSLRGATRTRASNALLPRFIILLTASIGSS
jgi:hypothetical protein